VILIAIGSENFWVISNTNGTIRALAEYNINVGNYIVYGEPEGLQNARASGITEETLSDQDNVYGTVPFSNSGTTYSGSLLEGYINDYIDKLEDEYGVSGISGDAITLSELETLGCSSNDHSCMDAPSWVYTTTYWSGSAYDSNRVWCVGSSAVFGYDGYNAYGYFGVRPVVVISES